MSRSVNPERCRAIRHDERGFTLAALIIFLTAMAIAMAAAVPAYQTQAQRERELELIFRGQEYVRAIQKYQRRFGIFPPSLDALLESNGIRFLRRPYTDPITGEEFRLLTLNPDGTINGSTLFGQGSETPLFQGGNPQMFDQGGASTGEGRSDSGGFTVGGGVAPPGGGGFAQGGQGGGGAGESGGPGFSGQTTQGGQQSGSGDQPFAAGGIVGVAPANESPSLIAYNLRERYNEWEFIALPGFGTVPTTAPPGTEQPPQDPSQQQNPSTGPPEDFFSQP